MKVNVCRFIFIKSFLWSRLVAEYSSKNLSMSEDFLLTLTCHPKVVGAQREIFDWLGNERKVFSDSPLPPLMRVSGFDESFFFEFLVWFKNEELLWSDMKASESITTNSFYISIKESFRWYNKLEIADSKWFYRLNRPSIWQVKNRGLKLCFISIFY